MQLITDDIRAALLANGQRAAQGEEIDPLPVVKLFTPDANATWLLTEADVENPSLCFGLCDLGVSRPELGVVSTDELEQVRGVAGMPVECDIHFIPQYPLSSYTSKAIAAGHISA